MFFRCRNVRKSSFDMINSTIINNFPNLTSLSLAYSLYFHPYILNFNYYRTGYITSRQIIDGVCDILRARNELKRFELDLNQYILKIFIHDNFPSRMLLPKELSDLTSCIQKRQKSLEHLKLTEGYQFSLFK